MRIVGSVITWLAPLIITLSAPACADQVALHAEAALAPVSQESAPALKKQIDALVAELLPVTSAGIKVVSLKEGDTLYQHDARLLLVPASNQKIFTAATALSVLGKDKEVTTTVALGPDRGTVYLKGCGDSMLTPGELAELAASASLKLDRNRQYLLSADLSCFDDSYWGNGWMWDDEPETDEMFITSLSVNLNAVAVVVKPGRKRGDPAAVYLMPPTSFITIENRARTVAETDPGAIELSRRPGDRNNLITVSGTLPAGVDPIEKRFSVWRPELFALSLFRDALQARGIGITGTTTGVTPPCAPVLALKSRPVGEMVRFMLKSSDNLTAESLLKLMGLTWTGLPGSAEAGSAEVRRFLEKRGIPTENLVLADGSGVSRYNLTNAETLTATLREIYRDRELYPVFYASLPIAGKDGTLTKRMKESAAEGNLRAKTGNMNGVSSLSGYATSADGEPLAFSIIIENFPGSGKNAREIQDRIAAVLCRFTRK